GPGTTLQKGYYWVRAVRGDNFHKYLQTKPLLRTGPLILDDYKTAGQFAVKDGQLVQLISAPDEPPKFLYATVSPEKQRSGRTLGLSFAATPSTYGRFVWQGDSLTWAHPSVVRKNPAAWFVCEDKQLALNLGDYMYQPSPGCVDETIHFYNDAKA
ncbi:hypothetical protein EJ08DRAFT_573561, partial [Tothia fuscella]